MAHFKSPSSFWARIIPVWIKFDYYMQHIVNNKVADQTVQMHKLVCAFAVHKPQGQVLIVPRPIYK